MRIKSNRRPLLPHQREALRRNGGSPWAALFLDMRLGKSLTCIRWLKSKGAKRVLLVAPSAPLLDWVGELEMEGVAATDMRGSKKYRESCLGQAELNHGWFLTTYQTLRTTPAVAKVGWDAVVLDESTAIKNPKAKVTKFITRKLNPPLKVLLSGLPNPQGPGELFTQLSWCCGDFMGHQSYWKWQERFFYKAGFNWVPRVGTLAKIKKELHSLAVVMTRKDAGLAKHVERKVLGGEHSKEALAAQKELLTTWALDGTEYKVAVAIASKLLQLAGGFAGTMQVACWKYQAVVELLGQLPKDEQVVLWCSHNGEAARLLKTVGGLWLRSEQDAPERQSVLKQFRSGVSRTLICNPALARYGLDLSNANTAVYLSNGYSYEARRQSEERINHPKKETPMLVVDMITKDSADEAVQEALRSHRSDAAFFMNALTKLRR